MPDLLRQVLLLPVSAALLCACGAVVNVTQTATGVHQATNPNEVEIIRTRPTRHFEELATVTANRFGVDEAGKMDNALRSKSAPLGADAVLILEEGIVYHGSGYFERWATGIAIRYR
jgi:hypothetical protein